jgi:hypothetical protein
MGLAMFLKSYYYLHEAENNESKTHSPALSPSCKLHIATSSPRLNSAPLTLGKLLLRKYTQIMKMTPAATTTMMTMPHNPCKQQQESSETVDNDYSWNEEAEIQFVIEHEQISDINSPRHGKTLHFPRRQERRARHIPGPWYMPAILLTW